MRDGLERLLVTLTFASPQSVLTLASSASSATVASSQRALSKLGIALHDQLARAPEQASSAEWRETASLLRDAACELAAHKVTESDKTSHKCGDDDLHAEARTLIDSLLDTLARTDVELHAIAKLSRKRNGRIEERRATERCMIELGIIIGTASALDTDERAALLRSLRPVCRVTPTSERMLAILMLCRSFYSPAGHGGNRGRMRSSPMSGVMTKLLHRQQAVAQAVRATDVFEHMLANAPEHVRRHSRVLRASFALVDPALRAWLQVSCSHTGSTSRARRAYQPN